MYVPPSFDTISGGRGHPGVFAWDEGRLYLFESPQIFGILQPGHPTFPLDSRVLRVVPDRHI